VESWLEFLSEIRILVFSKVSRSSLDSNQSPIHWITGVTWGCKRGRFPSHIFVPKNLFFIAADLKRDKQ
jgi:hypothetical protein